MQLQVPTVISLFAGCGGSSLGWNMAGFKILLAVEWEKNAVDTYKKNFPETNIYHGDINNLSTKEILEITKLKVGELDVLDGSPPCQGFSTAGKRQQTDSRNRLFEQYVRILKDLQPKAFVMENVSGMVKGKMLKIFKECLVSLKSCGYEVKAKVLNTKWYGVPQSRERTIFIGIRKDLKLEPSLPNPITIPISAKDALIGIIEKGPPIKKEIILKLWQNTPQGKPFSFIHPKKHHFGCQKLSPNKPSPTILKQVQKDFCGHYHWDEPRLLSISEIKRLQSFPDDFVFDGKFEEQWARIGNSVPPLFMKEIAKNVKRILKGETNDRSI